MAEVLLFARLSFMYAVDQASVHRRISGRENVVAAQASMSSYGSTDFICLHQLILHSGRSVSFAASRIGKLLVLFCTAEQMAAHRMRGRQATRFGIARTTYVARLRTARMKMAAGRRIRR